MMVDQMVTVTFFLLLWCDAAPTGEGLDIYGPFYRWKFLPTAAGVGLEAFFKAGMSRPSPTDCIFGK
jgi:hypothetical protein